MERNPTGILAIGVIGVQTAQAGLDLAEEVVARQSLVIGAGTHRRTHLRRDQQPVAPTRDRLAEDLLHRTCRVHVPSVDEVDAGVETHVDLAPATCQVGLSDASEDIAAVERHAPMASADYHNWGVLASQAAQLRQERSAPRRIRCWT